METKKHGKESRKSFNSFAIEDIDAGVMCGGLWPVVIEDGYITGWEEDENG